MERDSFIITTPVDKKVVKLISWLTAREKRAIGDIFLGKTNYDTGNKKFDSVESKTLREIQDKQIQTVVISVDDKTENVLESVLDMKVEDYEFVFDEVEKIVNPELKKKS